MTTIVINEKTKIGKLIMNMIRETKCGQIIDEKKQDKEYCKLPHIPNAETIKAMKDAKAGKGTKFTSTKELFKALDKQSNV